MPARPRPPSGSSIYTGAIHKMGEVRRRQHHHRLDGAGARARHHHHLRRHHRLLDARRTEVPHQHHRHARPRRLHHRGGALACACSTARSRCSTAVNGVEPQSETVWRQADKYNVPRICFVNKMDRVGADFEMSVEYDPRASSAPTPCRCSCRWAARSSTAGVIDLVRMKALVFQDDGAGQPLRRGGDPRGAPGRGRRGRAREADRGGRRARRRADGEVPRGQGAHRGRDPRAPSARAASR